MKRKGGIHMKFAMSKKLICSTLILSMCILPTMPVSAAEPEREEIIVTEEFAQNQKGNMRYGEREEITVLATEYRTHTVTPSGQPAGGFHLPGGGSIYVNANGGPTFSVGFSVAWGAVSVNVSAGIAGNSSSIGGFALPVPTTTQSYRALIDKEYKLERHKVDVYQYNEYKYTYYSSPVILYRISPYLQVV